MVRITEQFVGDLITHSRAGARRASADVVSRAHVERTAQYLAGGTGNRLSRAGGVVGGILLGAALSQLLAMLTSNAYTGVGVGATFLLGVLGVGGVLHHLFRD